MSEIRTRASSAERVLGGTPMGVFVRLLVMSFIVGIILTALDLSPVDLIRWAEEQLRFLSSMSFETLEEVGAILALGAVVVVPIWLILRVLRLIGR